HFHLPHAGTQGDVEGLDVRKACAPNDGCQDIIIFRDWLKAKDLPTSPDQRRKLHRISPDVGSDVGHEVPRREEPLEHLDLPLRTVTPPYDHSGQVVSPQPMSEGCSGRP